MPQAKWMAQSGSEKKTSRSRSKMLASRRTLKFVSVGQGFLQCGLKLFRVARVESTQPLPGNEVPDQSTRLYRSLYTFSRDQVTSVNVNHFSLRYAALQTESGRKGFLNLKIWLKRGES
jgi:hypothetical protein